MGKGWRQGYFSPRNPEKYIGDPSNIRFMSSWELELNKMLDGNPYILRWCSEPFGIPYVRPTDNKVHKYYPDYFIEYQNKHGNIIKEIIEVKPKTQVKPPKKTGKSKKQQLNEQMTYAINVAKWTAAKQFCDQHGITFRVVTEQQLFK